MSRLAALFAPSRPLVGLDIGASRVTVVRLAGTAHPAVVAGYAVEPLPPRAVVPALNGVNIADAGLVGAAVSRALERAGARAGRAALVVPDSVAKVSLLRFEKVPSRAADFLELIRWQMRKTVPFSVEHAQVSWSPGAVRDGTPGREFVVTIARKDVIQEYEAVAHAAGLQPGLVDLATFNLVNAALGSGAPPAGDWLVVHVAADYLALVILRGDAVIFYRHRGADDEASLADVVHQTAMYYEDRLQGAGFARVLLAGVGRAAGTEAAAGLDTETIRGELERRLRSSVELLDPRPGVSLAERITPSPALLDVLAPAVGLLMREGSA
jgi:type IV pilus assembly protein PilM